MDNQNTKPTVRKQFDRIQASIWRHARKSEKRNEAFFTFSASRSYRDAKGAWQRTCSFTARDLPHLQLAVEWAMRELLMKED